MILCWTSNSTSEHPLLQKRSYLPMPKLVILDICKRARGVSNYAQVYELSYNQLPPKTAAIIEFMQEHRLIIFSNPV